MRPTVPLDVPLPEASAHKRRCPACGVTAVTIVLVSVLRGEAVVALALHQPRAHARPGGVAVVHLVGRAEGDVPQGAQLRRQLREEGEEGGE